MNRQMDPLYSLVSIPGGYFRRCILEILFGFVRELLLFVQNNTGRSERDIPTSHLMLLM